MLFDIGDVQLSKTCQDYLDLLREMCATENDAYIWLTQVIQTSLIWDHIVDGDKFDVKRADEVFLNLVTQWPVNSFLRKFGQFLAPVLAAAVSAWKCNVSRDLEYSVYREVPAAVAFVLGGNAHVEKFMPRISELVKQMGIEDDQRDRRAAIDA